MLRTHSGIPELPISATIYLWRQSRRRLAQEDSFVLSVATGLSIPARDAACGTVRLDVARLTKKRGASNVPTDDVRSILYY